VFKGFFDFMAKMGLSVRDDPPRVVDLAAREWGEARDGLALSIEELPRESPDELPSLSVVLRNVTDRTVQLSTPGWLLFYRFDVRTAEGQLVELSPFGRELMKAEHNKARSEVSLAPGAIAETQPPIGSIYGLRPRTHYLLRVACEPTPGIQLTSNEIRI